MRPYVGGIGLLCAGQTGEVGMIETAGAVSVCFDVGKGQKSRGLRPLGLRVHSLGTDQGERKTTSKALKNDYRQSGIKLSK